MLPQRQVAREQARWLLHTVPSAFLGNTAVGSLLLEDAKLPPAAENISRSLPLLSFGKIADMTKGSGRAECSALALAVGDAGHILLILKAQYHNWRWARDDAAWIRLVTAESTEEGHWCGDGVPIHQIKFAAPRQSHTRTRWLLVQTAASTVVFEPVLHGNPVSNPHTSCGLASRGPSYISARPVLTLSTDQTGGNAHSDVLLQPESASGPPQLAIVDLAGNWCVWDISGSFHVRRRASKLC